MIFYIPPLIALAAYISAAPTGSTTASAAASTPTVAYASDDPNNSFLSEYANSTPEPIRGSTGASILGPQNVALERQGPDFLAPPTTDSGSVYVSLKFLRLILLGSVVIYSENVKWPMGLSHNRLQTGGWARQQSGMCLSLPQCTQY